MRRWAAAAGVAWLLAGSCTTRSTTTPTPGPGGGPVEVHPSAEPVPGDTVVLSLASDDDDHGSACTTLDEWIDGGWRARWYWERSSPTAEEIPEGAPRACPSPAVALPTQQTVALPAQVRTGTWRLAYLAGEDDLGSYVFEVG